MCRATTTAPWSRRRATSASPPATRSSRRGSDVARRAALITGAASGQGADLAVALAADGYGVALLDVAQDGLRQTAAQIEEAGGEALVLPTDVARRSAVVAAVAAAEERFGRLWLAAAVAGVAEGGFAVDAGEDHA